MPVRSTRRRACLSATPCSIRASKRRGSSLAPSKARPVMLMIHTPARFRFMAPPKQCNARIFSHHTDAMIWALVIPSHQARIAGNLSRTKESYPPKRASSSMKAAHQRAVVAVALEARQRSSESVKEYRTDGALSLPLRLLQWRQSLKWYTNTRRLMALHHAYVEKEVGRRPLRMIRPKVCVRSVQALSVNSLMLTMTTMMMKPN